MILKFRNGLEKVSQGNPLSFTVCGTEPQSSAEGRGETTDPRSGNSDPHPSDRNLPLGTPNLHPSDQDLPLGTPNLHPSDQDLPLGTPNLHPSDQDLSLGARDLHPSDQDLSLGARDLGHPFVE